MIRRCDRPIRPGLSQMRRSSECVKKAKKDCYAPVSDGAACCECQGMMTNEEVTRVAYQMSFLLVGLLLGISQETWRKLRGL
jgi:hypothetical protein